MKAFYITLTVVIADQLSKLFVKGIALPFLHFYYPGMQIGESVSIFGSFLRLTFVENPGMAFGIEVQHRPLLVLFTAIAAMAITWYLYSIRHERFLNRLPFAMILGGAIGNLIDRIFYGVLFGEGPLLYGKVVDFIDMNFFKINLFGYHMNRFAVYNIADASVSVGLVLMLLFHRVPEKKKPEAETDHTTEMPKIEASGTVLTLEGLTPDGLKSTGESDRGSEGTSIEE